MGDLNRPINFIFTDGSDFIMTDKYSNNSTSISGGSTVQGNQFAAGSKDFQGTVNYITTNDQDKIEQLTSELVAALKNEQNIENTNSEEIIDAVNQVRDETKKQKVNKLSVKGILTGINMVMTNVSGISDKTKGLYDQWHEHIAQLFQ